MTHCQIDEEDANEKNEAADEAQVDPVEIAMFVVGQELRRHVYLSHHHTGHLTQGGHQVGETRSHLKNH